MFAHKIVPNVHEMNHVFWYTASFFLGAAVLFVWSVRLFDRLDSAEEERRRQSKRID